MTRIELCENCKCQISPPFLHAFTFKQDSYLGGLSVKILMNRDLYYYFETLLFKQQLEEVRDPKMPSHISVIP